MEGTPSYDDVAGEDRQWTKKQAFDLILKGLTDAQISHELHVQAQTVTRLRMPFIAESVRVMNRVVLKDGRVIPLTPNLSMQLTKLIFMSTTMQKGIKIGDESFRICDIETDPERIAQLTQKDMFEGFDLSTSIRRKSQDIG